jgi:hypothetical protein
MIGIKKTPVKTFFIDLFLGGTLDKMRIVIILAP